MMCCIQRRRKWSVTVRTEFNKSRGRISMMRSKKIRTPIELSQITEQVPQISEAEATVSLTVGHC